MGYSVVFNLYGKCFKQDQGERCNGFFPFFNGYILNAVTYVTSIGGKGGAEFNFSGIVPDHGW